MYYEFYLDLYFLENFIINSLLLYFTQMFSGRVRRLRKNLSAAAFGAAASCALLFLPAHKNEAALGALEMAVFLATVFAAEKERGKRVPPKSFLAALASALVLGNLWRILMEYAGLPFAAAVPLGYLLACFPAEYLRRRRCENRSLYGISLFRNGKKTSLTGLLDTGNALLEPFTKRPVQILEFSAARSLLEEPEIRELKKLLAFQNVEEPTGKFLYIPYHTIGNKKGLLPAMTLDAMEIKQGERAWSTGRTLAAVTETAVSGKKTYQMILHPQTVERARQAPIPHGRRNV